MECIALVVAGLYTENHKVSHIAPLSPTAPIYRCNNRGAKECLS